MILLPRYLLVQIVLGRDITCCVYIYGSVNVYKIMGKIEKEP